MPLLLRAVLLASAARFWRCCEGSWSIRLMVLRSGRQRQGDRRASVGDRLEADRLRAQGDKLVRRRVVERIGGGQLRGPRFLLAADQPAGQVIDADGIVGHGWAS